MAERSAQSRPADTRVDGAINDVAIKGMTPAIETIQAFAREIAQMSGQALVRTNQHIEKLRKAQSMEEVASIERDFVKESLDHAVQHIVHPDAGDPPARAGATGKRGGRRDRGSQHAAAAKVARLSGVARRT